MATLCEIWGSDSKSESQQPELPPTGGRFSKMLEQGLREAIAYKQTLAWVYSGRDYTYRLVYAYRWSERGTIRTKTLCKSSVPENADAIHAAIMALPCKPKIVGNPRSAWRDYDLNR